MNIHTLKRLFALQYPVVQTASIVDGSVTAAKLADGSVTAAKLADGSVTAAKLAQVSGLSIIPLVQFRKDDTTRSVLGAAGSNSLGISAASGVSLLTTSDAKQAITTETAAVELTLPMDYVPEENMSLKIYCGMVSQIATKVSQKLKVKAIYHSFDDTNTTIINDEELTIPTLKDIISFDIAGTDLQPGGLLSIKITCTLDDTAGTSDSKIAQITNMFLNYPRYV